MTTTTAFTFDGDYRNLAQVFPFVPAYAARLAELEAEGRHPYNASFNDHIPGIDPPRSNGESTAVYLLQTLRHLHEDANRVNAAWDEGFRPLDRSTLGETPVKVGSLVEFGWYMGGTGFRRSDDVRLFLYGGFQCGTDVHGDEWRHRSIGVLAKGKRTRGRVADGQILTLGGRP